MDSKPPETKKDSDSEPVVEHESPIEFFNPWNDHFSDDFKTDDRKFEF